MIAKTSQTCGRRIQLLASTVGAGIAAASFVPAAAAPLPIAQQAVVQPIPGPEQADLANALRRLNSDPRSLSALIDAGNAALALGDIDGAIVFFGRAQDLAPNDPRIKAGLAGAYMRSDRPLDALRLFEEAERAGQVNPALASERGLAYDLVGDSASAQAQYNRALMGGGDPEATRRLALSQAIEGNREGFERTIRPLLDQRDFAAYRTRAFGLAILGDVDEAKAITDAVMPPAMAQRIGPYLQYMPRLTKSQQAAAANLGIFPRAAQIGRDDPRIARYGAAQQIDRALAPQGRPLGAPAATPAPTPAPAPATRQTRRQTERARQRTRQAAAAPASAPAPTPAATTSAPRPRNWRERRILREEQARVAEAKAAARAQQQNDARTERVSPTRQVAAATPAPRSTPPPELQPAPQPVPQPETTPAPQPEPVRIARAELPPVAVGTPPSSAVESAADPVVTPAAAPARSARPSVDIVLPGPAAAAPAPQPTLNASATTRAPEPSVPPPAPQDLSSAFADFTLPSTPAAAAASGAVDITAIKVPRETAPAPPPAPSRVWVQVATGKDRSALRFDWRRIARRSEGMLDERGPFVVEWGEANRLLAGPYDSAREANAAVAELKEKGQDAFVYTSPSGQEIEQLQ